MPSAPGKLLHQPSILNDGIYDMKDISGEIGYRALKERYYEMQSNEMVLKLKEYAQLVAGCFLPR